MQSVSSANGPEPFHCPLRALHAKIKKVAVQRGRAASNVEFRCLVWRHRVHSLSTFRHRVCTVDAPQIADHLMKLPVIMVVQDAFRSWLRNLSQNAQFGNSCVKSYIPLFLSNLSLLFHQELLAGSGGHISLCHRPSPRLGDWEWSLPPSSQDELRNFSHQQRSFAGRTLNNWPWVARSGRAAHNAYLYCFARATMEARYGATSSCSNTWSNSSSLILYHAAERNSALRCSRCLLDSMGRSGPYSIRQAREKAWPNLRCMPRNLPPADEFMSRKVKSKLFELHVCCKVLTCSNWMGSCSRC